MRKGQSSCPGSDTSLGQSVTGSGSTLANDSVVWACLSTARCVFWSLLNDCSKKIQCGSAPSPALLSLLYLRVRACECVCVCARAPGRGQCRCRVSCHGRGSTSARHLILTLSPLLGRDWSIPFFLTEAEPGWERMRSAAATAGASPT